MSFLVKVINNLHEDKLSTILYHNVAVQPPHSTATLCQLIDFLSQDNMLVFLPDVLSHIPQEERYGKQQSRSPGFAS